MKNRNGKLLKVYLDESQKHHGKSLYDTIIKKLKDAGVYTAIAYRGIEGFGQDGTIHFSKMVELAIDLPLIIEAVGDYESINKAIDTIQPVLQKGYMVLLDAQLVETKQI
ncbi:hypothetical protein OXPF_17680 [Oxobacter pfennigii]|uniref:Uncharacterized protein n=1 Tax=Oxobacter pfennigii TaxID=36849 RepID=A0A0P8YY47_9CLOT|nr:DUF190 domain-containing protein [Oxobacter pfennigii]KPU44682.1 hypothetical protein OXPF_17680 [Oxobacter pfennigii]